MRVGRFVYVTGEQIASATAHNAAGKGVSGTVDGHPVRVGRFVYVTGEQIASATAHNAQEAEANEKAREREDHKAADLWPTQLEPDEMPT